MSDSYTNLLYHIVFSTKDRRPLITPEYEVRLYDYLGGTIRKVGGISLELNGTEDQSHVEAVRRYIARQKEHHQNISFRDEFIKFLQENGIEYDERFI